MDHEAQRVLAILYPVCVAKIRYTKCWCTNSELLKSWHSTTTLLKQSAYVTDYLSMVPYRLLTIILLGCSFSPTINRWNVMQCDFTDQFNQQDEVLASRLTSNNKLRNLLPWTREYTGLSCVLPWTREIHRTVVCSLLCTLSKNAEKMFYPGALALHVFFNNSQSDASFWPWAFQKLTLNGVNSEGRFCYFNGKGATYDEDGREWKWRVQEVGCQK